MRNPNLNESDAAGMVSALLERLATQTRPAGSSKPAATAMPRQMSIVDFTEELLKQVARNKRT